MAEGYGKIYESTWWGDTTNSIYWGSVYANLAGGVVSDIVNSFAARVVADGGSVESTACLETDLTYLTENPIVPDFTGLLNDYSGAAAAYSLRLLDNTYSGNAVRVRRASDNTEQDIGFANNELDTTSLETFCSGTNGFVTTWYDQSGNAANAANATATRQPKIVVSGSTILEGGKPVLDLSSTTWFDLNSLVSASNLFSVISLDDKQFIFAKSTDSHMYIRQRTLGGVAGYRYRKNVIDYEFPSHIVNTRFLFNFNQANNFVKQNGLQNSNTTSTPSVMSIDRILADSNGVNSVTGVVQEFILWDNGNNNSGIETNINTHYSIY
jgi:hypothetical protein